MLDKPKNIYAHLPKLEQDIITCLELYRIQSKDKNYHQVKKLREQWAKQMMHHIKNVKE